VFLRRAILRYADTSRKHSLAVNRGLTLVFVYWLDPREEWATNLHESIKEDHQNGILGC
jgi:hypothetical protein